MLIRDINRFFALNLLVSVKIDVCTNNLFAASNSHECVNGALHFCALV